MTRPSTLRRTVGAACACVGFAATSLAGGDAAAAAVQPSLEPPAAPAPQQSSDFRVFWRDGVRFETADKAFSAGFGGRIHNDWAWQSADDELGGGFDDGVRFRRARMHIDGKMYEHLAYKIEFDFASGPAGFRNVYLGTSLYDFATVRVGHFKEPFGLEQLTSSNNITFVERSLPDVFTPAFNSGLCLNNHHADGRFTWGLGIFRDTNDQGRAADNGGYAVTGRVTCLPMYDDEGKKVMHLGLSATHRNVDSVQYAQRPENSFAPQLVDTGAIASDDQTVFGVEAALAQGSFSVQGEYMLADVSSDAADDPGFSGFYAMVSYFLTGEHRPYRTSAGAFDRVRPGKNYGKDGKGAWEVAVRYSSIDLNDGAVAGGELDDITAGVNWYLNPNSRVMLNYIMADADLGGVDGDAEAVLLRFQVTF